MASVTSGNTVGLESGDPHGVDGVLEVLLGVCDLVEELQSINDSRAEQ